jgi:uncharacterized protein YutE (UPF0331/DUF86 family)
LAAENMLEERLKNLDFNIAELRKMASVYDEALYKSDTQKQWALRYGLFESIQIVIDIACHITSEHNLGNAKTYRECIDALHSSHVVDNELANKLKSMIGFRNILIHEYVRIDQSKLPEFFNHLDDFQAFSKAIEKFIK